MVENSELEEMSNRSTVEIVNERRRDSNELNHTLNSDLDDRNFGTSNSSRNNAACVHHINYERRHDARPHDNDKHDEHEQLQHSDDSEHSIQPLGTDMDNPRAAKEVNIYQQKKTLAQGMMDLALLSANANQLRYVVESATTHPYYYSSLMLISLSLILQIAVGVGLVLNSRYVVKNDIRKADKTNNWIVLGIFMITIVNVFITSFSVATPTAPAPTLQRAR